MHVCFLVKKIYIYGKLATLHIVHFSVGESGWIKLKRREEGERESHFPWRQKRRKRAKQVCRALRGGRRGRKSSKEGGPEKAREVFRRRELGHKVQDFPYICQIYVIKKSK